MDLGCFIPTLNNTGFVLNDILDEVTKEFISFSSKCKLPVLEIGAAFGKISIESARHGATVIANDIDENHLSMIYNKIDDNLRNRIVLLNCDFEDIKLNKNSIEAIFCSRVIHFFDPEKIIRCLKKSYNMLSENGKIFLTVESPYLKNWNSLPLEFEKRKISGDLFPGYVQTSKFINQGFIKNNLPEMMNFFDAETLSKIFTLSGFHVDKSYLFARPYFPQEIQLDGRESVAIVATKK